MYIWVIWNIDLTVLSEFPAFLLTLYYWTIMSNYLVEGSGAVAISWNVAFLRLFQSRLIVHIPQHNSIINITNYQHTHSTRAYRDGWSIQLFSYSVPKQANSDSLPHTRTHYKSLQTPIFYDIHWHLTELHCIF